MLSFNSRNSHELSHRGGRIPSKVEFNNKEDAEDALLAMRDGNSSLLLLRTTYPWPEMHGKIKDLTPKLTLVFEMQAG